jgi:hypothetical protein
VLERLAERVGDSGADVGAPRGALFKASSIILATFD